MSYKLLHAHGNAGPKYKRSYLTFGTYKTKKDALKIAKKKKLSNYKIVPKFKVKKTKHPGLYYISQK